MFKSLNRRNMRKSSDEAIHFEKPGYPSNFQGFLSFSSSDTIPVMLVH